jgi:hypothetical protein
MFNLEQAILDWRRQMLAAGIKSPVPLDELECHLRDEIDEQGKAGLGEADAFRAAVKNLGPAPVLQPEFKKVERKKALGWSREFGDSLDQIMITVCPYLFSVMLLFIGGQILFKNGIMGLESFSQQVSCWAALATSLLFVWSGRWVYWLLPVIRTKRMRDAVGYVSGALMAIWLVAFFYTVAPWCLDNGFSFVVVFLWGCITPIAALAGLVFGIETAARKKGVLARA